jgi:hypothetical protein
MSDDAIFEFLHSELINYVVNQNEVKNKDGKVTLFYFCERLFIRNIPG